MRVTTLRSATTAATSWFASVASNLVSGDTNHHADVFVRDRRTATTRRVSTDATGAQANDGSLFPSLSGDGRYVAFTSLASNLVPGDTNRMSDLFVRHAVIPSVTGATPADGSRGTSTTITITGTGFHKNAVVALGAGVSVRAVTVVGETRIRADITIAADSTTGLRNIQVTNVGAFGPTSARPTSSSTASQSPEPKMSLANVDPCADISFGLCSRSSRVREREMGRSVGTTENMVWIRMRL